MFDLEAELYEEYLNKIYDLCSSCQSKVKFEITKQDGILKQYLLTLGKFDYFFEFGRKFISNQTSKDPNKTKNNKNSTNCFSRFSRLVAYFVLFISSLMVFIYNEPNSDSNNFLKIFSKDQQHLNLWMDNAHLFIYDSVNITKTQLNIFQNLEILNSPTHFFSYLNSNLTSLLLIVYITCLFLFITSPSPKPSTSSKIIFLMWIFDLVLIFSNYKLFLNFFKTDLNPERISVKYVDIMIPSIHLGLICLLANQFCLLLNKKKSKEAKVNIFERGPKQPRSDSHFLNNLKQQPTQTPEPFARESNNLSFTFNKPQSYSMMKFLQTTNQPKNNVFSKTQQPFGMSQSCYAPISRSLVPSLIKPAKFMPDENVFPRPKCRNNSVDSSGKWEFCRIINRITYKMEL